MIIKNVRTGFYPDGSFLPSEGVLAKEAGVSVVTVRGALKILKERKIVVKRQGQRSRVDASALPNAKGPLRLAWIEQCQFSKIEPVYLEMFTAIQRLAVEAKGSLIFMPVESEEDETWALSLLDSLDGVFTAGLRKSTIHTELAAQLSKRDNVIELDQLADSLAKHVVCTDNYRGGQLAATYLVEHGRRKIAACINEELDRYLAFRNRLQGGMEVFERNHVAVSLSVLCHAKTTLRQRCETMEAFLARNPDVDAFWTLTDFDAVEVMNIVNFIRPDLAARCLFMGYDGVDRNVCGLGNFATVRQPAKEIGEEAFSCMLELISDNELPEKTHLLEPELIPFK